MTYGFYILGKAPHQRGLNTRCCGGRATWFDGRRGACGIGPVVVSCGIPQGTAGQTKPLNAVSASPAACFPAARLDRRLLSPGSGTRASLDLQQSESGKEKLERRAPELFFVPTLKLLATISRRLYVVVRLLDVLILRCQQLLDGGWQLLL